MSAIHSSNNVTVGANDFYSETSYSEFARAETLVQPVTNFDQHRVKVDEQTARLDEEGVDPDPDIKVDLPLLVGGKSYPLLKPVSVVKEKDQTTRPVAPESG